MSLPPEVARKVKQLEIAARKLVNSVFAGQYLSAFRGQGMTFAEFREYVPGDDVRTIAWPLTARTGKTFIKKFDEERELILILAVDISASLNSGSQDRIKGEVLAHLAALLGFSALRNNDLVGLLLFSDEVEHFVPPRKGQVHLQRILRDIYGFKPRRKKTNISVALDYLRSVVKKRAHVFMFSDFEDQNYLVNLRQVSRRHEVIACCIRDPLEINLPDIGLVDIEDPETGEFIIIDTSSPEYQRDFKEEMIKQIQLNQQDLFKSGVARIDISTQGDFVKPLIEYFRLRAHGGASARAPRRAL